VNTEDHPRRRTELAEEPFEIQFPQRDRQDVEQDEEWCEVRLAGQRRWIRFHDYEEIYAWRGLYEQLFYEELKCDSPRTVCGLLAEQLDREGIDPADLRVFDVGAGNGMVGEELKAMGASTLVGVDIIEAAAGATARDRPDVYDDYFVLDLTDIPADTLEDLRGRRFNCMTTVAALGFGDMPPDAFAAAFNLVEDGGHVAFNIKEDFMTDEDASGFSGLIRRALEDGTLELEHDRRYQHRLSVTGEPLHYLAMVAGKRRDIGG
jgi:predicted TPR repeat methyltransferase